jgi:hypothetical protein
MRIRLLLVAVAFTVLAGSAAVGGEYRRSCQACCSAYGLVHCPAWPALYYGGGSIVLSSPVISARSARAIAEAFPPPRAKWRFDLRTRVITVHSPW